MHVLFEEDGGFKAGTIFADNDTSLQVEMPSGKRQKLKAAQVLLRFPNPAPSQILGQAESIAAEVETEFLWECAGDDEFGFIDLARDYFGHEPSAEEAVSLLLALHAAPVYFHRKGKGRFRRAPANILQAALASLEKKRQQALALEGWVKDLKEGRLPPELAPYADSLLGKPDRNRQEVKAFEAACAELGCSIPELLLQVGALKSPYEVHFRRFLLDQFPKGTGFPPVETPAWPDDLPHAGVSAFSIDDAATTEVDDAFSLTAMPGLGWRVGIHIAAPGLAIAQGGPLDAIARARLSTVYMPGHKITMLPEQVVSSYTLEGGRDCPALSLYLTVDQELNILSHESRAEIVNIAANLRHHDVEPWFNAETVEGVLPDRPFKDELLFLWQFSNACEGRRGKPSATQGIFDYDFKIEGDLADPESCRVEISERKRGSPLDKLVAELMIVANSTWGGVLAENNVACLYRAQTGGKARMTTAPQPHEGLGVPQYAWMTSPLRRYCDLVNQWQLAAHLQGRTPVFGQRSAELFAAMRDFELTYAAYAEFQRNLERYWCLRWLQQEGVQTIGATVRRDELVKLDDVPLLVRVAGLPELLPGRRISLKIDSLDLLGLEVYCHLVEVVPEANALETVPEDITEEVQS